ncbi:hypothetical protein AX15_005767 [Amanita polypyramis BW_CC]|nr:hypothetical protein AX15_005767 [Amanita polypyramis BW_CC]
MPSLTRALVTLAAMAIVSGAPAPWDRNKVSSTQNGNAYTGPGGQASGGSISMGAGNAPANRILGGLLAMPLINILSNNAGDGGDASSGDGLANLGHRGLHREQKLSQSSSISNAYTGAAGNAMGGSVNGPIGLINLMSNNAGDGGDATSGNSETFGLHARR